MRLKSEWLFAAGIAAVGILALRSGDAMAGELNPAFTKYDDLFKRYGKQLGVPWRWIKAVAMVESNLGRAKSVARGLASPTDVEGSKSSDGKSWGIMQTTLTTAQELEGFVITESYLNNAENSIRLGTKYLAKMIARFGINDRESVIRAYNGGPGFKNTAQGKTLTPLYYAKFVSKLDEVLKLQPGNERALS